MQINKRGRLKILESDVQRACIDFMRAEGWLVRPAPRDARKAAKGAYSVPPGEPDLLCVKPNPDRVLWIECKSATGKLSDEQIGWHMKAIVDGYDVRTVRSVDELKRIMRER